MSSTLFLPWNQSCPRTLRTPTFSYVLSMVKSVAFCQASGVENMERLRAMIVGRYSFLMSIRRTACTDILYVTAKIARVKSTPSKSRISWELKAAFHFALATLPAATALRRKDPARRGR